MKKGSKREGISKYSQLDTRSFWECPLMTSDVIQPLLTYLAALPCHIMSNFGGYFGPPTYHKIGRHLWKFLFAKCVAVHISKFEILQNKMEKMEQRTSDS